MQPTTGGPIKIGYSKHVSKRHKELESEFGTELAILTVIDGDFGTESEIHQRFSHLRFKGTEQFRPAPDLMAFIGRPLLVAANPETTEVMRSVKDRYSLIRVSDEFAELIKEAASFDRISVAKYVDLHLLPVVREQYRNAVISRAREMEKEDTPEL